jgi:diguanylate cyclase (GGDEF)-like protein
MQSALDITEKRLALLKTLELDEACATVNAIVTAEWKPSAVGVLLWDPDMETFSDMHKFAFGGAEEEMMELMDAVISEECEWDFDVSEVPDIAASLNPVICYRVENDRDHVAIVFVAGDAALNERDLAANLSQYPINYALANCFEVAELRRDSERRENACDALQAELQEERLKNSEKHSAFKSEVSDKERLIYAISNVIRSTLDPNEMLNLAVNEIGPAFELSRCLIIWPKPEVEEYVVAEYNNPSVTAAKDLFHTPRGEEFVKLASTKLAPNEFGEGSADDDVFNKEFLAEFGFQSALTVPLVKVDRNLGTVFLQDCAKMRIWSIDTTSLIGALADMIAVAVDNANLHEEKKRQAVTDGLTGISNRRHFSEEFTKEFNRAKRYGTSLSLVIVDLDFLKKINDTFGHHVGDEAIKAIGNVVGKSCRGVDTAARFGGEEFCLILPETNLDDAMALAERVRKLINEIYIEGPGNISASIGVAAFPLHAQEQGELFERADQALYAAKQGGRNRVCAAVTAPP